MSSFKNIHDLIKTMSEDTDSEITGMTAATKLLKLVENKEILKYEAWMTAFDTPIDFYCFYANKLQLLIEEMNKAENFLIKCKTNMGHVGKMKKQIMERDSQINCLQTDVTDLKCSLLQERNNYQTLLREHELMKLEKEDYSRKYNAALLLGGVTEKDVGFLMQNNPKSTALLDKIGSVKREISNHKSSHHEQDDRLVLRKRIATLESHVKHLEKAKQSDADAFHETLSFAKEEKKVAQESHKIEAQKAAEEMRDVKALSLCLMKSKMDLLKYVITVEEEHLQSKLELSQLKQTFNIETFDSRSSSSRPILEKRIEKKPDGFKLDLERAKNELLEKENTIKEYELKFCCMEKEYRRSKEVHSLAKNQYQECRQKLNDRIKILEERNERENRRRRLVNTGFHEDIRNLRQFLTNLEKRINSTILKQCGERIVGNLDRVGCARIVRGMVLKSEKENQKHENNFDGGSRPMEYEALNQIFRLTADRLTEVENKIFGP